MKVLVHYLTCGLVTAFVRLMVYPVINDRLQCSWWVGRVRQEPGFVVQRTIVKKNHSWVFSLSFWLFKIKESKLQLLVWPDRSNKRSSLHHLCRLNLEHRVPTSPTWLPVRHSCTRNLPSPHSTLTRVSYLLYVLEIVFNGFSVFTPLLLSSIDFT